MKHHVGICRSQLLEARAYWDGYRSVRLKLPNGKDIGLATTAYSFSLSDHQKAEAARAIADAWNATSVLKGGAK